MRHNVRRLFAGFLLLVVLFCTWASDGGGKDILSPLKTVELPFPPGERSISQLLIAPDGNVYGTIFVSLEKGTRFFRYDPDDGSLDPVDRLPETLIQPTDLLHGTVKAWAWDASRRTGYSLSPMGALQLHHEGEAKENLGQVAGTRPSERMGYQVSNAFFFDAEGNVYTAGRDGVIYRYSPGKGKLEELEARLPAIKGREPWASLDAAVSGPDGLIYGGSFDGYLFTFNPKTNEVVNLGKPLRQQRIQGLAFSKGKLYGVGGEEEGLPRAFAFDLKTHGFELGGTLTVEGRSAYHAIEMVGGMVADSHGNIYIGSTGRLGNLYVWQPK